MTSSVAVEERPPTDREGPSLDRVWHACPIGDVLSALGSGTGGLPTVEVEKRAERFGPNKLRAEAPPPAWFRFLSHVHDVLIYVLLGAALVTALLGEWVDTGVILGVVVVNALIEFVQEDKAEAALASIRGMLSPSACSSR